MADDEMRIRDPEASLPWHGEHSFFDTSASRIEVEHCQRDHPDEYDGTKQVVCQLTVTCAGVEDVTVELDYPTAMAFVRQVISGFGWTVNDIATQADPA